jgi:hypothetical protein
MGDFTRHDILTDEGLWRCKEVYFLPIRPHVHLVTNPGDVAAGYCEVFDTHQLAGFPIVGEMGDYGVIEKTPSHPNWAINDKIFKSDMWFSKFADMESDESSKIPNTFALIRKSNVDILLASYKKKWDATLKIYHEIALPKIKEEIKDINRCSDDRKTFKLMMGFLGDLTLPWLSNATKEYNSLRGIFKFLSSSWYTGQELKEYCNGVIFNNPESDEAINILKQMYEMYSLIRGMAALGKILRPSNIIGCQYSSLSKSQIFDSEVREERRIVVDFYTKWLKRVKSNKY